MSKFDNKNYLFYEIPRGIKGKKDEEIPNAQWALPENVKKKEYRSNMVLLGAIDEQLIGIEDNRHVLTVAGSRSGKSVQLVGNLIHYRGSALVIDPKGELANITAVQRAKGLKQKIVVLDPFDRTAPWVQPYKFSYNPLSILTLDSPTIVEDAGLIADGLVVSSAGDPHFDESARNFIEGVILHVASSTLYIKNRNLITVWELLAKGVTVKRGDKIFRGIQGLIHEMAEEAEILERKGHKDVAGMIEAAATDLGERAEKERGSVVSTIRRNVKFLGYKALQNVLQKNDFDLSELKLAKEGMTIYLCLPAGRMATCNRWLRMFINLALEQMERLGEKKPATGVPILFCLDEFPVLQHMTSIEVAAGQIASFHVRMHFIIQDLSQLKALYKDRWETFLGNSGILQFYGNNDVTTLKFIQERLSKTSVDVVRQSYDGKTPAPSQSLQKEVHDLITIDEASRFFSRLDPLRRQLVIYPGVEPIIMQRVVYYDKAAPYHKRYFEGKYKDYEAWKQGGGD